MRHPITWKKSEIVTLRGQMEDIVDRFFDELSSSCFGPGTALLSGWDVAEDDKQIVLKVHLPNLDPKKLEINLTGDLLTVTTRHEDIELQEQAVEGQEAKTVQSSVYSLRLPCRVKRDEIVARYANDVLEILLPKEEKSVFKVQIKG